MLSKNPVLACATAAVAAGMGGAAMGGLTVTAHPDGTAWVGGTPAIATMPNPQSATVNHGSLESPQDALAQTFRTGAEPLKIDKIQIYVAGAPAPSLSLHLFPIAAGGEEPDGFVNVGGQTDLLNPSNNPASQLTFQFFGTGTQSILELDLTAEHEVTLAANTKYSLEVWAEAAVEGSLWWRRIGASPYPNGNYYTLTGALNGQSGGAYGASGSGVGQDNSRFAIVGPGRDAAMAIFAVTTPVRIAGDTNGDGVVDLGDLNNVLNNFGDTGTSPGDDNGDGVVDLEDLNRVLNNFGDTAPASALSVVPEPAALSVVAVGVAAVLGRRRRG